MNPKVSIIVRTKNEERWIGLCLEAIFQQKYKHYEVVLVDNRSTDKTVAKARSWPITVIDIDNYKPGLAINKGIRNSSGDTIVCISGHCIPKDSSWLENLVAPLIDTSIGGVYGRQEPLLLTSELNRRDLYITFGQDSRIQEKDCFFHNANSAFRRDVWQRHPFDEEVSNIEDRIWGREILAQGLRIRYEASASVYHHHGIHHDSHKARAKRIVEIMEVIEGSPVCLSSLANGHHNIAILATKEDHSVPINMILFQRTLKLLKSSPYLRDIVVSASDPVALQMAGDYGCFIHERGINDGGSVVGIQQVYCDALLAYENEFGIPDSVSLAHETYPFRHEETFNLLYRVFMESGADSVVCGAEEKRSAFILDKNNETILNRQLLPRKSVDNELAICSVGLGCVANTALVREKAILSNNILVLPVQSQREMIEVKEMDDLLKFRDSIDSLIS